MISGLLGLRVDVDTHDGMRDGVPRVLDVMAAEGVKATFYLSMGPDRSERSERYRLLASILPTSGRSAPYGALKGASNPGSASTPIKYPLVLSKMNYREGGK